MRIPRPHTSMMHAVAALTVLALPLEASAQTIARVASLFNIFVGLMLTAALMLYAAGFSMWLSRLGTWPSFRTQATRVLEWAVMVLFVLVVLLGIVGFFRDHPTAGTYIVSAIIVAFIAWAILLVATGKGGEKKEE